MIKGKKVRFRPVEESDLNFCQSLFNDPYLRDVVVGWDFPVSMDAQKKWFYSLSTTKNNIRLVIETHEDKIIGLTGLWDIDWHNRNALTAIKLKTDGIEGKGYGRDAIMAMNAFSFFDVGLHRLWSTIIDYNIPSFKVYVEKSGWKTEGVLREHTYRNGFFHNLYYVACLKEDFLNVPDSEDYIPKAIPAGMSKFKAEIYRHEKS